MKKMKRILATFMAIALIAVLPGVNSITAKAAAPKTFTVKYDEGLAEWRVQMLASWDDAQPNGGLDFLWSYLADGDAVVVLGGSTANLNLTFNVNLGNLTLYGVTTNAVIYSNASIKDIYVLKGTKASLNGNYENVYVYDNSACNVNNDVKNLYITGESSMTMNVAALGKVDYCKIANGATVLATMYNVQANSLRVTNGTNTTPADTYSTSATDAPATPATPAPGAGSNAGQSNTGSTRPTSPKTGETGSMWLLAAGLVCLAGAYAAKKKFA